MPFSHPLSLAISVALIFGCSPQQDPAAETISANARPEIVEMMRRDLAATRHPADGGGRGWIESGPRSVPAGSYQRWQLVYEAGPLGIAEGGMLFLQVSPFWGWSTPQTTSPDFEGYTLVSTEAGGIDLVAEPLGQQLLAVRIAGRGLEAGERIDVDYGAGRAGARADVYAESESHFWFAVDGDGDGVRRLVEESPSVEVVAGFPTRLILTAPSTARPGEEVALTLAVLDAAGNSGTTWSGEIRLTAPPGLQVPGTIRLEPEDGGRMTVPATAKSEGVYRVRATGAGGLEAESNPLSVAGAAAPVLWADLHGHSGLSDGTGTPGDYLTYAREIAALDVVALTDHDHWGLRPLSQHRDLWQRIRRETEEAHQPGRFVTLPGYEWTSWIHGHRHVLHFGDGEPQILSSIDPATESPTQLWAALRGQPALTLAHHSAGAPVATNWEIPPDPELEPVTEIASVHGSSEAADSPRRVAGAIDGNFVRDALDRGYRLGVVGSGDSHDGHPGLAHLASPSGGLAALVGAEPTRASVLETLRARRVYATNGPRILLEATLDGQPMGSTLEPPARARLRVAVEGTGPLDRIDLIRTGAVVESVAGDARSLELARWVEGLAAGEYLYVRVVQTDGGAAWSSPFFFD